MNATTRQNYVTEIPAASSERALRHFQAQLEYETDCWDVHDALTRTDPGFVLLDVRSSAAYGKGHVRGAIHLPHAQIRTGRLERYGADTLFVVYCAGPHCNGAHRAAIHLARLGRPVKVMIGGVTGWLDEGLEVERSEHP